MLAYNKFLNIYIINIFLKKKCVQVYLPFMMEKSGFVPDISILINISCLLLNNSKIYKCNLALFVRNVRKQCDVFIESLCLYSTISEKKYIRIV